MMTLDDFIDALRAVRNEYGGDVQVQCRDSDGDMRQAADPEDCEVIEGGDALVLTLEGAG